MIELKRREETISQLEEKLNDKNFSNQKDLKISTTI